MIRALMTLAGMLLAAFSKPAPGPDAAAAALRNAGTALATSAASKTDGERLFQTNCAVCHANGRLYPGTLALQQHGQPRPVLAMRTDLDPDYVRQVVRAGIGAMPAFSPTHVTDADLDAIAVWLSAKK